MTRFVDEYMPNRVAGYPFQASPRFSTTISAVANGGERANQNWEHPLHRYTSPEAIACWDDVAAVHEMWMALAGPAHTFPLRDPLDSASVRMAAPDLAPAINRTDQILGVGDGFTREFQLQKRYTFGSRTYDRLIYLPVTSSVLIGMNALPPDTADPTLPGGPYTWSVSRYGGIVTFDVPPEAGIALTAGFLFDVEVRFESDDVFDGIVQAYRMAGRADLSFFETRPCS